MKEISDDELHTEWEEEIVETIRAEQTDNRWGITAEEARSIFKNEKHFMKLARNALVEVVSPSDLVNVRNYSQVAQVIKNYLKSDTTPEKEQAKQEDFFGSIDKQGEAVQQGEAEKTRQTERGQDKKSSYQHKIKLVREGNSIIYPLLLRHNGELSHISGHTRQTGAVTNKMILPVKVIDA